MFPKGSNASASLNAAASYLASHLVDDVMSVVDKGHVKHNVFIADVHTGQFVDVRLEPLGGGGNGTADSYRLRCEICTDWGKPLQLYEMNSTTLTMNALPYKNSSDIYNVQTRAWYVQGLTPGLHVSEPYEFFGTRKSSGNEMGKFGVTATMSVNRSSSTAARRFVVGVDIELAQLSKSLVPWEATGKSGVNVLLFVTSSLNVSNAALLAANDNSSLTQVGPLRLHTLVFPTDARFVNNSGPSRVATAANCKVDKGACDTGAQSFNHSMLHFGEQSWTLWAVIDLQPVIRSYLEYSALIFVGGGGLLACLVFFTTTQERDAEAAAAAADAADADAADAAADNHVSSSGTRAPSVGSRGSLECTYCKDLAIITGRLQPPIPQADDDDASQMRAANAYSSLCDTYSAAVTAVALRELHVPGPAGGGSTNSVSGPGAPVPAAADRLLRQRVWLALQSAMCCGLASQGDQPGRIPGHSLDVVRMLLYRARVGASAALLSVVIAYEMLAAGRSEREIRFAVRVCALVHGSKWRSFVVTVAVLHCLLAFSSESPDGSIGYASSFYVASWACVAILGVHIAISCYVERKGPVISVAAGEQPDCLFSHKTLWHLVVGNQLRAAQAVLVALNCADLLTAALSPWYRLQCQYRVLGMARPIMIFLVSYHARQSLAHCYKALVEARNVFLMALSLLMVSTFALLPVLRSSAGTVAVLGGASSGSTLLDSFIQSFTFLFAGENFFALVRNLRAATDHCHKLDCAATRLQEFYLVFAGFAGTVLLMAVCIGHFQHALACMVARHTDDAQARPVRSRRSLLALLHFAWQARRDDSDVPGGGPAEDATCPIESTACWRSALSRGWQEPVFFFGSMRLSWPALRTKQQPVCRGA